MHFLLHLQHTSTLSKFLIVVSISFQLLESYAETDYQWTARSLHNRYRWKHWAKSLRSNEDLHKRAVKCAQYYVDLGSIDHSCPDARRSVGENIWAHWGGNPSNYRIATRSVSSWYAEESQYKYRDSQRGTGHFTQMVWKETRELGFGIARKRNMAVAVALYSPAGNYVGEHHKNVGRP